MTLNLTKFVFQRNIFKNSSLMLLQSYNGLLINNGIRLVTIRVVKPCPVPKEDFDGKNKRLGRFQSPHLSIYKPQLTSMLSITHRFTGVALIGYTAIFGLGSLFLPHDFSYYLKMVEDLELSATILTICKMILVFPVAYHYLNGIRHLLWDFGYFLSRKSVYLTGYIMIACTFCAAVGLAML